MWTSNSVFYVLQDCYIYNRFGALPVTQVSLSQPPQTEGLVVALHLLPGDARGGFLVGLWILPVPHSFLLWSESNTLEGKKGHGR